MHLLALAAPILFLALAACDRAGGSAEWGGTIDTLESGIEVVRNPAKGIWDSSTAWRLVENLRIGSVKGEGLGDQPPLRPPNRLGTRRPPSYRKVSPRKERSIPLV